MYQGFGWAIDPGVETHCHRFSVKACKTNHKVSLFCPDYRSIIVGVEEREKSNMTWITSVTADQIMLSLLACYVVRETMAHLLPDDVAGPGGWLVDTGLES